MTLRIPTVGGVEVAGRAPSEGIATSVTGDVAPIVGREPEPARGAVAVTLAPVGAGA